MNQPAPGPATPSAQPRVLTAANAPIFFAFLTWGFGSGAQQLGRPLFALALTGNVFLVSLLISMNAIPRLFTGPITGLLTDRFGRKPLVVFGAGLRGVTNFGQFMTDDFAVFFALEFVGQIGVSMWNTSSNVLLSDVTTTTNRGRVLALRQMSMRLGFIAGPAVGGLLAASFGLRSLFLLNSLSKILIVVVVFFMVKETRPKRVQEPARSAQAEAVRQEPGRPEGETKAAPAPGTPIWSVLRTRSFVALALAISGTSMTQTAVLQTLLPIHAQHRLGVDEIGVGLLITVAAVLSFLVAFPNGMMSDRFGRKVSFVPGLLLLTAAMTVLTVTDAYVFLLLAVAIQGAGEGMTMGTSQTYAMDLAPPDRRGAFLGIVMMFQASGAFAGPLVIGALYSSVGPSVGFGTLAVWLTVAAMAMAVLARETAGSRRVDPGAAGRR